MHKDNETTNELRMDAVAEKAAEEKINAVGSMIKSWWPIAIAILVFVASYVTQSNRTDALVTSQNDQNLRIDALTQENSDLKSTLARIDERTTNIQNDVSFIKSRIK